ncbi:MAG: ATP-binding protein [Gemmatimonadaceae bacterium]|nr:ATP-binding protein [Gemmatimonadaceae bacterium]
MAGTRIVLTGPECTGKTTLASALAEHFGAPWVPEAARRFAETATEPLSAATVEPIARLWITAADAALAQSPPLCFFDTDLVSTVVYARHYYGQCPAWIEAAARTRRADLYLLGTPDLPWTPDGIRDRPLHRETLFADFGSVLRGLGARTVLLSGKGPARTAAAVRAIETLLRRD